MKILSLLTGFVVLMFVSCATHSIPEPSAQILAGAKEYPLDTCMVIDKPLKNTKRTFTKVYKGQQVKFCCTHCYDAFDLNPDFFMQKLERLKKLKQSKEKLE